MVFICEIAGVVSSYLELAGNLKRRITNKFGSYRYFVVLSCRGLLIAFRSPSTKCDINDTQKLLALHRVTTFLPLI
jgi:hypothetical protein